MDLSWSPFKDIDPFNKEEPIVGPMLAVASKDGSYSVWEANSGKKRAVLSIVPNKRFTTNSRNQVNFKMVALRSRL